MQSALGFVLGLTFFSITSLAGEARPAAAAGSGGDAAGAVAASRPLMFGVILIGRHNDHGWSEAPFAAAQYVKRKLPGVDFIYLDRLNPSDRPGTTLEQVVADMKAKGVRLVLTTSDDLQTDTLTVARKRPELTFVNVSGDHAWKEGRHYEAPPNLGNFMGRWSTGR